MTTKKMTLHELLVAIKMTKKKIESCLGLDGTAFISIGTRGAIEQDVAKTDSVKTTLTGNLQKITALIANLETYEKARALANATTTVRVGDVDMTISDAIKAKENIAYKKSLLGNLKSELASATASCSRSNTNLLARLDKAYSVAADATAEAIEAMAKAKEAEYNKNETILIDPNGVEKVIAKLSDEIDAFEAQIDSALSYINAVTTVEVTFEDYLLIRI